jgi:hypothetical protein
MQLAFAAAMPFSYAYVFPDAFLFGTMFVAILEISLAVLIMFPVRRKRSLLLFLIGITETMFSVSVAFIEGFFIGLTTMLCAASAAGAISLRSRLSRKQVAKPKNEGPTLKTHRKGIVILIAIILISGAVMFQYDLRTRPAYADFSIDRSVTRYYPSGNNSIAISCNNWGDRDCSFYLILTFQNATISNQTQQPYTQVDSNTAKFLFSLQKSSSPMHSGNKVVYFKIDENVTGFSCHLNRENAGLTPVTGSAAVTSISYGWNETSESYDSLGFGGFVI